MEIAARERVVGVQLGRFAPYHKGHQMITEEVLKRHGIENSLIIIGSSNAFNERTPFTYEQRKALIQKVNPCVQVVPMPDINPALALHSESTIPLWLERIRAIQAERGVKFKFYGGDENDLRFFKEDFDSEVLIDRETEGKGISATQIRELLHKKAYEALKEVMDELIIEDAIAYYHENLTKIQQSN